MAILATINVIRQSNGLSSLSLNSSLSQASQTKAQAISASGVFSHSTGGTLEQLAQSVGYEYKNLGENLAQGQESLIMTMWMNSPSHRANILNPAFTEIGIGQTGDYTVTLFGTPQEQIIEEIRIEEPSVTVPALLPSQISEKILEGEPKAVTTKSVPEIKPGVVEEPVSIEEQLAAEEGSSFFSGFFPQAQASPSPVVTIIHDTSWLGRPSDLGIYFVVLGVVIAFYAVSKFLKPSHAK